MRRRLGRRALLAGTAGLFASLAGCPSSRGGDPTAGNTAGAGTGDLRLGATAVGTGLRSPADVIPVGDGDFLVAEQPGRIVHLADGDAQVLLDLEDRVVDIDPYDERGLLGLAAHPDVGDNGRLFVRYSAPPRAGTPDGYSHTFVLSEFALDSSGPSLDPDSERTILEIPEPQPNHNAGGLLFGPDGLLYVPVGDGGGEGDAGRGHAEDWYDAVDGGNGQDVTANLLGSLLRIDVDAQPSGATRVGVGESGGDTAEPRPYGVPGDNPLVDSAGLDEHYAWGFRNPWGLSVDGDGRLYLADVGQERYEEVDVVERGGNYGWNVREGPACYGADECPTVTPDGTRLREPVVAYGHGDEPVGGVAIVGGHRYEGEAVPELRGRYVFGDWQAEGRLFVANERAEGQWPTEAVPIADDGPGRFLLSIGRTRDGELLICTNASATIDGADGAVHRITAA